jgi:hypothetical protein
MIYVDALQKHPSAAYRDEREARRIGARHGDQWCHLFADSVEELRRFARKIGLRVSWEQGSSNLVPHFDLTPSRRAAAVAAGAQEIDRRQTVDLIVRLRGGWRAD